MPSVIHVRRVVLLVAAFGLLATACGDDAEDEATPSTTAEESGAEEDGAAFDGDACALLTDEQVAEILGDDVTAEAVPADPSISQPAECTWRGSEGSIDFEDPQPSGITLFVGDPQIVRNTRVLAERGELFAELEDVGDEAFAGNGTGGVLVGDIGITVSPLGTNIRAESTQDLIVDLLAMAAANA